MQSDKINGQCEHLERKPMDQNVEPAIVDELGKEARVLPLYEKQMYELAVKRHYSLENNELLRCRWLQYKSSNIKKEHSPFQFPNVLHEHFHNYRQVYRPEESGSSRRSYRLQMRAGPGVDRCGSIPVPDELMMKRTKESSTNK